MTRAEQVWLAIAVGAVGTGGVAVVALVATWLGFVAL